ncbi:MAG: hypothetical protein GXO79_00475 [Chlorobi bacterium]|nr:hypothetical protein [Chlorobiota bacterium]
MKKIITYLISFLLISGMSIQITNARHLSDNNPKCRLSKSIKINKIKNVSTLNSTNEFAMWNFDEFESELPVTDLAAINFLPEISWMFPAVEAELEVTDLMPISKTITNWKNVEEEPELKVLDLVIK